MKQKLWDLITSRVRIGPGARQLRISGTSSPPGDPLNTVMAGEISREEAVRIWLQHQQHAYEVTAVVTERLINRALGEETLYPPFGLKKQDWLRRRYTAVTSLSTFDDLMSAMKQSLFLTFSDEHEELLYSGSVDPVAESIYNRWQQLHRFANNHLAKAGGTVFINLNSGANTAAIVMSDTLEKILKVYRRDFQGAEMSLEDFLQAAENSYAYVAEVAMLHKHQLKYMNYNIKDYVLVWHDDRGFELKVTEEAWARFLNRAKKGSLNSADARPTFGCVAMVNFHGNPAVRELWSWHIRIAAEMYRRNCELRGRSINTLLGT